jgi:RNA polymerase sigma-70 factor, ECF subfamily
VKRLRVRDRGFDEFFAEHFDQVWRHVRRRCESAADADDVTAEVFAVAWRRRADMPTVEDAVIPWLYAVARRVLANHRRGRFRADRLRLRLIDNSPQTGGPAGESVEGGRVADALRSLSEDAREIVLLRCWDGLAISEIAQLLDRTPNAVSIRLHWARARIAEFLAPDDLRDADFEMADADEDREVAR